MSARLLSLFVRYGSGSHGRREGVVSSIHELHLHYRRRGIDDCRVIVIDNARPESDGDADEGTHWVVPGDNTRSEFSAWDRGVDCARRLGLEFDAVHLVTSTFLSSYDAYTRFVDERLIALVARTPLAVGHIDAYNEPVELFGRRSQHWIRTAYVLMSRSVLESLGSLVSAGAPERIFANAVEPDGPFCRDAPLGHQYREILLRWLSGADLGQSQTWHSARDLRDDGREVQRKLMAMLDEHMLSVRLREAGVRLVDAIWLGHNFQRVIAPLALAEWHPDWRRQLRERPLGGVELRDGMALHYLSRIPLRGLP